MKQLRTLIKIFSNALFPPSRIKTDVIALMGKGDRPEKVVKFYKLSWLLKYSIHIAVERRSKTLSLLKLQTKICGWVERCWISWTRLVAPELESSANRSEKVYSVVVFSVNWVFTNELAEAFFEILLFSCSKRSAQKVRLAIIQSKNVLVSKLELVWTSIPSLIA